MGSEMCIRDRDTYVPHAKQVAAERSTEETASYPQEKEKFILVPQCQDLRPTYDTMKYNVHNERNVTKSDHQYRKYLCTYHVANTKMDK